MASILVDNWTLESAANSMTESINNNTPPNYEYIKLVEAIVLWDHIYYIDNQFSDTWKRVLRPLGYDQFLLPADSLCDTEEEYKTLCDHARYVSLPYEGVVACGAIEYRALSDQLCIAYLPSQRRAEFLANNHRITPLINRDNIYNSYNDQIDEFYIEINNMLGQKLLTFDFPVLFDFVFDHAPTSDIIDKALEIKNMKDICSYRSYMDNLEQEITNGNYIGLRNHLDEIRRVVESIINKRNTRMNGELQLSITPSIIPSFNANIPLTPKVINRKHHLDFFRRLTRYALHERKR